MSEGLRVVAVEKTATSKRITIDMDRDSVQEFFAQYIDKWLGDHPAARRVRDLCDYEDAVIETLGELGEELGPVIIVVKAADKDTEQEEIL